MKGKKSYCEREISPRGVTSLTTAINLDHYNNMTCHTRVFFKLEAGSLFEKNVGSLE